MPPNDAVQLINMIPRHGFAEMRGGHEVHSNIESNTGALSDGTNYLDGGDIAAFDFANTQDFSLELWTKHSGGTGTKRLIGKRDGADAGWNLDINETTEDLIVELEDDSANNVSTTITDAIPDDGAFHHIAITVDRTGDELLVYIDNVADSGNPVDISSITAAFDAGAIAFRTHANSSAGEVFDGTIDEVRVWSDIRTAQEISDNYLQEISGSTTGLIGYWKMQGLLDASIVTIADETAGANTLTDTGAGDMTFSDTSAALSHDIDVDLVTEFYDGNTRQLITASPTNIYNSTAAGAATSLGSGFTNGRWDVATFNGTMGFVNGVDAPQDWDGVTLGAMTVSGSGLTVTDLVGIHIHKSRSYFWEKDNQSFWYSATNALGGTLTEFQLGEIAKKGGKLLRMSSWTVDGGSGPDDFAVFIMDTGEVIVYQGDNPGSALAWGIVGIYNVGEMVNDRAVIKFGGQLMAIAETDLITMPAAFQQEAVPATKLSGALRQALKSFGGNPGWELFTYPSASLLFINVPIALNPDSFDQYVLNLQNFTAARFTNLAARTWGVYNETAYFGSTNGIVYSFDTIASDDGGDIHVTAAMAWSDFGIAENKQITALRPTFSADDNIPVAMAAAYDFKEVTLSSPMSTVSGGTPWGSAWGSPWGTNPSTFADWRMSTGRGSMVSINLKFSRQGDQPKWYKTDTLIRPEGNL